MRVLEDRSPGARLLRVPAWLGEASQGFRSDSEKLPPAPACEVCTLPVMKTVTRTALFHILGAYAHHDDNDGGRNVVAMSRSEMTRAWHAASML